MLHPIMNAPTAPYWVPCRKKVSGSISEIFVFLFSWHFDPLRQPWLPRLPLLSVSFLCKIIAFTSLGWYRSHVFFFFAFSSTVAELQPHPRTWPQAHHDRWLGGVGEAQRRPHDHQETHREDGGGESPPPRVYSFFSPALIATCGVHCDGTRRLKGELCVVILSTTVLTWKLQLKCFWLLAQWLLIFHHNYHGWQDHLGSLAAIGDYSPLKWKKEKYMVPCGLRIPSKPVGRFTIMLVCRVGSFLSFF